MKENNTIVKERNAVQENTAAELNKIAVSGINLASALIGCWAVACLASGLLNSGPVGLVTQFATSFTG